jgi:Flp pilus assembly protein TadD
MHDDGDTPGDGSREPNPGAGRAGNPHATRGVRHLRRGRLKEAADEFRKAIDREPARGDLRFNLGIALDGLDLVDDALEAFREAARLLPRRPEAHLAAGAACCRAGRFEEALPFLDRSILLDRSIEPAWARRIIALAELGRHEDADLAYFEAQQLFDRMPGCLMAMGESRLHRGENPRAAWCFREALRLEPDTPRLRARLARALAGDGDLDGALGLLLEEHALRPDDAAVLVELGQLYLRLGRPREAVRHLRLAVDHDPREAFLHLQLGSGLLAFEGPAAALPPIVEAHRLAPDLPGVRTLLGQIHAMLGERDEAIRVAREEIAALAPDPDALDRTERLTRAAWLLGESGLPAEGAATLIPLVEADPSDHALLGRLASLACRGGLGRRARGWCRRLGRSGAVAASLHNLILHDLSNGRLRGAGLRLRAALRRFPDDSGLRRLRAAWWLAAMRQPHRLFRR